MRRKDCDRSIDPPRRHRAHQGVRLIGWNLSIIVAAGAMGPPALAGSVRVWPTAVVVEDAIKLADIAELRGFDSETLQTLSHITIVGAPKPGGSHLIHVDAIRQALAANGANLAEVLLCGATQCAVQRPAVLEDQPTDHGARTSGSNRTASRRGHRKTAGRVPENEPPAKTLRQAVIDHFNRELARYEAKADVVFQEVEGQVLELTSPPYEFRIRRRLGKPLGLVQIDADVSSQGRLVQTIPLGVRVSMIRREVVARRAINQSATIRRTDVELSTITRIRLDRMGVRDTAFVVGQRARKFVSPGTVILPEMVEAVPLVTRGQLVTLTTVNGPVRIVTTAKAMSEGFLGKNITVRTTDKRRLEMEGTVVGPGVVRVGGREHTELAVNRFQGER